MTKRMLLLTVCLVMILVVTKAETNLSTYNNETFGYQLKHPSDWIVTSVDSSPTGQVVFEAENNEALIVECSSSPTEITNEIALEYANEIVAGIKASAKKNGSEITFDTEPSLYETENNDFVKIAGMLYNDKGFRFLDVYLLASGFTLYSITFTSWSQDFYDQIKGVVESFTLVKKLI